MFPKSLLPWLVGQLGGMRICPVKCQITLTEAAVKEVDDEGNKNVDDALAEPAIPIGTTNQQKFNTSAYTDEAKQHARDVSKTFTLCLPVRPDTSCETRNTSLKTNYISL